MKEHPILFSGDMVRAILNGDKTQTRRPSTIESSFEADEEFFIYKGKTYRGQGIYQQPDGTWFAPYSLENLLRFCPYGQVGDRLWVRETFCNKNPFHGGICGDGPCYRATDEGECGAYLFQKWQPSIHMPRSASRITLEITHVQIERVQHISEKDAWAEGIAELEGAFEAADLCATAKKYELCVEDARTTYAHLWDILYAGRGLAWNVNPWVWKITFKHMIDV